MPTDVSVPSDEAGYAAETVTKAPEWHGLVAWDLLFNNLATGLFLTAALGELLAPATFTPLAKVAYPVALILLLVDLTCLVLDLGDPLRFHHMLRVFKPTSPMSLGTWCLTAFSFPLAVAAALALVPEARIGIEWGRKAAVVLGLLPAFGAAAYKGVLLSTTSQPGWRDARWLGSYLTNSALLLGCAALLALSVLTEQERTTAVLRPALMLLLVFNALALSLLLAELRATLVRTYGRWRRRQLGMLAFGGGMLTPFGLVLLGDSPPVLLTAVLLLLLGSLAIRFVIIQIPHVLSHR